MKKCIVTGSFDPITIGHLDIIDRALRIFDYVYVGLLINPLKKSLFEPHDKQDIALKALEGYKNVEVITFYGMAVDLAKKLDVKYFVRGLRDTTDYVYEVEMADYNRQTGDIDTICLITDVNNKQISSSIVRQRLQEKQSIKGLVPENCEDLILEIYKLRRG